MKALGGCCCDLDFVSLLHFVALLHVYPACHMNFLQPNLPQ